MAIANRLPAMAKQSRFKLSGGTAPETDFQVVNALRGSSIPPAPFHFAAKVILRCTV